MWGGEQRVLGEARWIEVTPSQFPHEAEGFRLIRELLPDEPPFYVWSNFEFRDGQGKWHEVDAVVLGRRRMHVVELKYYSGTLRGNDQQWLRDGKRAEDSPLKLARRKAQRLGSKLRDELVRLAEERKAKIPDLRLVAPFVQEAVFLHHPQLRCLLPMASRRDLFGPVGMESETLLPSIDTRLLEPAESDPRWAIGNNRSLMIATLMERIGAVQRRQREAGNWIIDEEPLDEGEGWQDWPAFHKVRSKVRARIRFVVNAPGTSDEEVRRRRQIAEHEFDTVRSLSHDGILRPTDIVDSELGIGLVYPLSDDYRRLDLWLADHPEGVPLREQLALLRQVGEAVGYAHRHRVVHRGLTPAAVLVRDRRRGGTHVVVADWQGAGSAGGSTSGSGMTSSFITILGSAVLDARADSGSSRAVYEAPEGVWSRDADRVRLDVYALGSVAYYLLTGRPPAADRAAQRERLRRDDGLDISADLSPVPSALRTLILEATRPGVGDRLPDVATFLERLADVERIVAEPEPTEEVDPLAALPGTLLAGRFQLERRLGAGSTAAGLYVTDFSDPEKEPRPAVLKVALDDAAGARLAAEAEVLAQVSGPRIVKLLDGPLHIGGRTALLLQFAGEQTLAEVLHDRVRLSLDLLERYGTDLLEAVVTLESAGVDHRDIKPGNLGVLEGKGGRAKHLVLYDFSLTRAAPTAVHAGTQGYLDPFLSTDGRDRFDTAAERYSAAAVLFEMSTGSLPMYGEGSDPVSSGAKLTISAQMFDPAVASGMVAFFRKAFAPTLAERFHTAREMLTAWTNLFSAIPRGRPEDADERAAAATVTTPLAHAGLSVRALSLLEPLGVATVGELIALDPVALNRLRGGADVTRREVKSRARAWRERLGRAGIAHRAGEAELPDPRAAALALARPFGPTPSKRREAVHLLLGLDGAVDAFIPQADLGLAVRASRQRGPQLVSEMQRVWADDEEYRTLLDALRTAIMGALDQLGGVATVDELTDEVRAVLAEPPERDAATVRISAGLLRVALDRAGELNRAEALDKPFVRRRRDGRLVALARRPELINAAEALGHAADDLVRAAEASREWVVSEQRAAERLAPAFAGALDPQTRDEVGPLAAARLVRLAAGMSREAAVAGNGALYSRGMRPPVAVALTLGALAAGQSVGAQEVRDRVRARFPDLPVVPDRPRLDAVLEEAGLRLVYDEAARSYRTREVPGHATTLQTRVPTRVVPAGVSVAQIGGHAANRLAESVRSRSFLALGVDAAWLDRTRSLLERRHGVTVVDVTQVLLDSMRRQAAEVGLPWEMVRAADAAAPGSRDAAGLAALVSRALPDIDTAIEAASVTGPVLIVEAAPLARYGHLGSLARWTDLSASRPQAIWLLVPLLHGTSRPLVDGLPVPLGAPGQYLRLDDEWLASRATDVASMERAKA
jgi:serine/threonine protein kinase